MTSVTARVNYPLFTQIKKQLGLKTNQDTIVALMRYYRQTEANRHLGNSIRKSRIKKQIKELKNSTEFKEGHQDACEKYHYLLGRLEG